MSTHAHRFVPVALLASLLVPAAATAQYDLPIDGSSPTVHLEWTKPFFEDFGPGGPDFGFATSILDASVVVPTGGTTVFAKLGLSHASTDLGSDQTLSNLKVGLLFATAGGTEGEVHVDLPTARGFGDDDTSAAIAFFTDPERLTRFNEDFWSIGASLSPRTEPSEGAVFGGRIGVEVWIPQLDGDDSELGALAALFGRMTAGGAELGAEVSGLAILSEEDSSFGERTIFLGTLSVGFPEVGGAPEVYLRLPLDEDTRELIVDAALGVRVRLGG